MTDKDVLKQRVLQAHSQPYEPLGVIQGVTVGADLRVAHALEYIASQLGQINAKLDKAIQATGEPGTIDAGNF